MHVFHNARERMRRRRRDGEVSFIYPFFWYAYHVLTFWTLPNWLVEWEVKKINAMSHKALPKAMAEWSEPLTEDQWAQPSEELKRQSKRVLELQKLHPQTPMTDIFTQVSEEFSSKNSMTA